MSSAEVYIFPMTPPQRRLWVLDRLQSGDPAYNVPLLIRLCGAVDDLALERALAALVERHEILRTTFGELDGELVQLVHERMPFALTQSEAAASDEAALLHELADASRQPFNLRRGPLLRAHLYRRGSREHLLFLNLHHIVCDRWSLGIIAREVMAGYNALVTGNGLMPEAPEYQYADYAEWLRETLTPERVHNHVAYWREALAGLAPAWRLQCSGAVTQGGVVRRLLAPELAEHAAAFARTLGATPFMPLVAVFTTLLHRYGAGTDVPVATPVANRDRSEFAGTVGFFVNTLVLRVDCAGAPSLRVLTEHVRDRCLAAYAHQGLPFDMLLGALQPERTEDGRSPLVQVMFAMQNTPMEPIRLAGLEAVSVPISTGALKNDLTLILDPAEDGGLLATLEFDQGLFTEPEATAFLDHYAGLLAGAVAAPDEALPPLPLTPQGKVGRAALPQPQARAGAERAFVGPRTATEQRLVTIWEGVLRQAPVGVTDNFFAAGGDSILALQVVSRARKEGLYFTPRQVFEHQTIAELARAAETSAESAESAETEAGLAPIQHWFFGQGLADTNHWNQSVTLILEPSPPAERLKQALAALVARHAALRLRFGRTASGAGWRQRVVEGGALFPLEVHQASVAVEVVAAALQTRLDLESGPIAAAALIPDPAASSAHLVLAVHHLAIDGVSWRILIDDLGELLRRPGAALPPPPVSFVGWAARLAREAARSRTEAELPYWMGVSAGHGVRVPRDSNPDNDGDNTEAGAESITLTLDTGATEILLRAAPRAQRATAYEILVAALAAVFHEVAGGRLVIAMESQGREEVEPGLDLSQTVGWCTSLYPFCLPSADRATAGDARDGVRLIWAAKEAVRTVPRGGIGYGLLRYLHQDASVRQALGSCPAPELSFNYLGQVADVAAGGIRLAGMLRGPERGPRNRRPFLVDVAALVVDGRLRTSWTFHPALHRPGTIRDWAERFCDRLRFLLTASVSHAPVPSPVDYPLATLDARELGAILSRYPGVEDIRRLSPMQQGILFHAIDGYDAGLYVEQITGLIRGHLDRQAFVAAWNDVIARHRILRSAIEWRAAREPCQVVVARAEIPVCEHDWRELHGPDSSNGDTVEARFAALLADDRARGLQVTEPPLMRLTLVHQGDQLWRWLWTHHHIILDGWSLPILFDEVMHCYEARVEQRAKALPPPVDYAAYLRWLARRQGDGGVADFWCRWLQGVPAPQRIDGGRCPDETPETPGEVEVGLCEAEQQRLEAFARAYGITLNTLLLGTWLLLLRHHGAGMRPLVGVTVAGRPAELPEAEHMMGLFINTLPVSHEVDPAQPTARWLQALQESQARFREMEHCRLIDIRRWVGWDSDVMFESLFVFENYPVTESLRRTAAGIVVDEIRFVECTNYPLTVAVVPGQRLLLKIAYDGDRFHRAAAQRLLDRFRALAIAICADGTQPLGYLSPLTDSEKRAVLGPWATRPGLAIAPEPAHAAFERSARTRPEAVALEDGHEALTYGEIERRANRAAHRFARAGVGPETLVALLVPRSIAFITAVLGVLKAGGAWLPLDPDYPEARLLEMLTDSGARHLVCRGEPPRVLVEAMASRTGNLALIDLDAVDLDGDLARTPPDVPCDPTQLAYVIYTSGSTGKPKGVLISHAGVANNAYHHALAQGVDATSRVYQFSPSSFDASVAEIFTAFIAGATLCLPPESALVARDPLAPIRGSAITHLTLPPSVAAVLDPADVPHLRCLTLAGEAGSGALFRRWSAHCQVLNAYGPTETTVCATLEDCTELAGELPLGRAMPGKWIYLLDEAGELVPPGVPGEIAIGGLGTARGYHDRPDMTAAAFVPDPFSGKPGARLYRTGDVGVQLADGRLRYIGRIDRQIKSRGFRLEPGEVEAALGAHPAVLQAVVRPQRLGHGAAQLVAYVEANASALGGAAETTLLAFVATRLPPHARPSRIVLVSEWPRLPNGKIAIEALPLPDAPLRSGNETSSTGPLSATERALIEIWSAVLQRPLGLHDSFFHLGGDSILSLQIAARARQMGLVITPRQVLEHQTVAALAAHVNSSPAAWAPPEPAGGPVPLSPIQRWFFGREVPDRQRWNQSVSLALDESLDVERLSHALHAATARHDAFRLRFVPEHGSWQQYYTAEAAPGFHIFDLRHQAGNPSAARRDMERLADEVQGSLHLERGPLVAVALFRLPAGEPDCLLITAHHLVMDVVSWRLLLGDLEWAYGGRELPPPLGTSFRRWNERLEEAGRGGLFADQLPYWERVLEAPVACLPIRPHALGEAGTGLHVTELDRDRTRLLLNGGGARARDVLLAALTDAVHALTGIGDLCVDVESHGRASLWDDLDVAATVGWFTALYLVRLERPAGAEALARVEAVSRALAEVPGEGIGFGVLSQIPSASWSGQAPLGDAPPRQIGFNYLGELDAAGSLPPGFTLLAAPLGREDAPGQRLAHPLEIEARVSDGVLAMRWRFDRQVLDEPVITALAAAHGAALVALLSALPAFDKMRLDEQELQDILGRTRRATLPSHAMTTKDEVVDIYPLSPLQQGLLFHSLYAPEASQYFEQLTARLEGDLDVERFEEAWQEMAARHAILRSAFVSQGAKEPVQVVMKEVRLPVQVLDWRGQMAGEQERLYEALLLADQAAGFALHRPPLMRVSLVRTSARDWRLVWSHHHLLLDGWSLPLLLRELFTVYQARTSGRAPALPRVRPYGDYIAWLQHQDGVAAETFWRATLGDWNEATPLSMDCGGESRPADQIVTRMACIGPEETEALRRLAAHCAVTINTVVQAAWAVVLGRHGRSEDVVFGVTVSGRPAELPGADEMVGLFINTLPLRARIDPDQPLGQWLPEIQKWQSAIQRFAYSSLVDVHTWSGVPRGQPLFHTLYAFENFPLGESLDVLSGDVRIREPRLVEKTNYPITLVVVPGTGLNFKLSYDSERIPDWAAAGLLEQLDHVLACMAARPQALVREIGLMPEPAVVAPAPLAGRGPAADAPSLSAAFARAAQRFVDRTAITDGDRSWTYGELDARASAIAGYLQAMGVGPETMVGLLIEKSAELIAAMLGVVKAGGAYVPMDPRYPLERLRFMVSDSGCATVLASWDTAASVGELPCPVIDIAEIGRAFGEPASLASARDHAAYVIYTSGSTGTPKGVVVTQHNLLRLFSSTHHWFAFDERDVWTFFHSFSFDFSVWEVWGTLLHGARLVVVPYHLSRDPDSFYELLARERVTVLSQTPSAFGQLIAAEERRPELPQNQLALRLIVFGGEALDIGSLRPWFARHGDCSPRLVNMYGITETTVHVTYRPITAADAETPRGSLVGRPIPDLEIRLLDAYGHPAPDGVPGEICVAGAGVARGYLHRPELTAERFVRARSGSQARLYMSGDLARRLPDGDLQYIGRADSQVKIRGFRVELSEIEYALATHPAVAGALALVHDDDEAGRLVAYFIRREGRPEPTAAELRDHLRRTLPGHMVPGLYVALDAFPLTLNGKIDRQALPDPLTARVAVGRDYTASETAAQAALARIWAQVLGVARVGLGDDYFALGGDSIRAIRVVALAKEAGLAITLRDLFAHPTLHQLAAVADQGQPAHGGTAAPPTLSLPPSLPDEPFALISAEDRGRLPGDIEDAFPLARLQAGMIFSGDDPAAALLYHDVFSFRLRLPYDESAWRHSLQALLAAHPVLRTSFHFDGYSEPLQLVHRDAPLPLQVHDLRGLSESAGMGRVSEFFEAERRARYDWRRPGLWRVHVVRLDDERCELLLACHHAILDGWSLATFIAELADHYLFRLGQRQAPPTAPAGNALREFVALERQSEADVESRAYWDEVLADAPLARVPGWPGERRPGRVTVNRTLSTATTEALRGHTATVRMSLRSLLLAVHARALALLTGQADLVTGVISNGRPETTEGTRALGLFLNTVSLRLRLPHAGSWLDLARAVQEAERALIPHRRVPMAVLQRRHGGRDLFATSFNYVHFHVYEGVLGRANVHLEHSRSEESIDIPFAVTFSIDVTTGILHLSITADTQAITPAQAEAAADLYARCASALAADPAASFVEDLADLPPSVLEGERQPHPFEPVHEVVIRLAARAPHAIAVELGEHSWTYEELARAAGYLAARLVRAGLHPAQPVALIFERSFALVAAMLGTLQAGGAYVPVDTDCPRQRLAEMLADLDQPLVLADATQAARVPTGTRVLVVDDAILGAAPGGSPGAVPLPAAPERPAYVLFTSGSTGKPRGVVVSHGALANHMAWFLEAFPLGEQDVLLQKTPYTFDASVWEFWATLMSGSRLRLARPDGHRDPAYMAAELARGRITVLQLVPSVLDTLLDEPGMRQVTSLRYLFCGGEALRRATVARAQALLGLPVINLYGPTEATIQCAYAVVSESDDGSGDLAPLGRPIHNVTLSVRDDALRVVPVSAPGELCVAGPCLALGYWQDKAYTAERFVDDPVAPWHRVLRTGDRARLLPDGTLQFLGRLDEQLKVRGMRVEPGEVEVRLALLPGVAQAVIAARIGAHGRPRLVAWVEPAPQTSLDALRSALAEQVPDYMMPVAWVPMSTWPRLTSGKIDRRALPEPPTRAGNARAMALRPGLESTLAVIWREVLAISEVGADDDFFALGGDSILAMQMVARARGQGLALTTRDVFSHPVLRDLAARAEARSAALDVPNAGAAGDAVQPAEVPLTPVQAWFVGLQLPNPRHWNHALLLALREPVAAEHLERAVRAVVARRDAFRLRLMRPGQPAGSWHQVIGEHAGEPVFQRVDLSTLPVGERGHALREHAAAVQTSLDPEAGHLIRAVHYDLGTAAPGKLLLVCHHFVVDGLSWRLLLQDLALALTASEPLPPAGSFAVCARRLAAKAATPEILDELPFWQEQLRDLPALPVDYPEGLMANCEGTTEVVAITLPEGITSHLLGDVAAALRVTPHELLLAAFVHALAAWSCRPRAAFVLDGHGRAHLSDVPDAAAAVGWLTALYPVGVALSEITPMACVKAVKTAVRAVPGDGCGYGVLRHGRGEATLVNLPEPAVSFNYLGRVDGSFERAPFTPAYDDVGPAVDPAAARPRVLDLVIRVESGRLQAAWQFSPRVHDRRTIERVATLFTGALDHLAAAPEPRQALCAADFPLARISDEQLHALLPDDGELDDFLPLSPVQEGMLYHARHDRRPGVYVQQVVAELRGEPQPEQLEHAWQVVLAAHPMLRASYVTRDLDRPLQRIHDRVTLPVERLDVAALGEPERQEALAAFLEDDCRRGFAIERPPLMRLTLVRATADTWLLVWTHHHLLLDGWSLPIVFRDFLRAYEGEPLTVVTRVYSDFLRWIAGRDRDADAAFWCRTLANFPGATMPAGAPVADSATTDSADARMVCSAHLTQDLERAARRYKVTTATLLQAAWTLVLGRHCRSEDVVIGVTVSGRPDDVPGAATAVGTFINTLPLRVRLPPNQPIADWLADILSAQAELLAHQASALVDVARWVGVPGGAPLFEAILVHENYPTLAPLGSTATAGGALMVTKVSARENNHYPLSLYVLPGAGLSLALYYQTPRHDRAWAGALLGQVERVLEQLAAHGSVRVGDLVLTSPADMAALDAWNATARPVTLQARPAHERCHERAALAPGAIAVIADDTTLTYQELDMRVQRLARCLVTAGVGAGVPVGICLARSADMVVALLGVLETGGHYVPLDPDLPDARLAAMIADAAPAWVLTDAALENRLGALGARPMLMTAEHAEASPVSVAVAPESLAYAIFTSGSTGRPKGVMIPHRALSNILESFAEKPGLGPSDRLVSVTTLSFDIAALEILLPLAVGATVIVASGETAADPRRLGELLARSHATVMQATPATWRMLLSAGWQPPRADFRVWCGGEALTAELAAALLARGVELWNVYGPTETTIWSTINRGQPGSEATLVGRPIANTTCYVVDHAFNLVPPGIPGELVIGGAGLAHGYLGLPALTAERFVPDAFGKTPGARLYRTGDLARLHADGHLEVMGRLDFQVKVRGFRVELGEIEATLTELPGIAQAVVVAATGSDGEARLIAYLKAAEGPQPPSAERLREQLAARLPAPMIPSAWRYVDAYPLTANRKIDRRALAAQCLDVARPNAVAPRTPLERALVEIWKQILAVPELGVDDSFFELGGHSLAAARIHTRLNDVFRVDVPLAEFLRRPTVAGLAELIQVHDPEPGRSARIAAAYLRVLSMSDEDKARLRAHRKAE